MVESAESDAEVVAENAATVVVVSVVVETVVNAPWGSDHSVRLDNMGIALRESEAHVHRVETVVNVPQGSGHSVRLVHVLSRLRPAKEQR